MPFVDLAREYAELGEELDAALLGVVRSGRYVLGRVVEQFEEEVAARLGVRHAVGVASGTDALWIALEALGLGPGDEVITSPFTFPATARAILRTGATPVFAEIQPGTFNLDPAAVAAAVGPATMAILAVHLFGQMADLPALEAVAGRHGLILVEDAAQAFGASQAAPASGASGPRSVASEVAPASGASRAPTASRASQAAPPTGAAAERLAGTVGAAGCFSFYPTKNLGGLGDGGLVATDDAKLAERLRRHRTALWNSRLDAVQAAALRVKLPRVEAWNERRRAHAAAYDAALRELAGISSPAVAPGNRHVYHQYTVRCGDRSRVRKGLEEARIGYGIYYATSLHLEPEFRGLGEGEGAFPEAEKAAREALSLPVFPGLREAERERVIAALGAGDRG
ncbi:MAG: DegT/DnrJ/EryC1/StrS family aminotransferase, partial [Gemmatimonadota bacterium]